MQCTQFCSLEGVTALSGQYATVKDICPGFVSWLSLKQSRILSQKAASSHDAGSRAIYSVLCEEMLLGIFGGT